MKNSLIIMQNRMEALWAFMAKYKVEDRFCCVSHISDTVGLTPGVSFFPGESKTQRQWLAETFGRLDWIDSDTAPDDRGVPGKYRNATKEVDGVRVTIYRAKPIVATPTEEQAVLIFGQPSEVAA